MPKTLIAGQPDFKKKRPDHDDYIRVSEMFSQTIQGEGYNAGVPSTFLRMQGCTLNCVWCDTVHVWKMGNPYTIQELLDLMEAEGVVDDFMNGHHFILTGGSPVLQQEKIIKLLDAFVERFKFLPYVEIENECTLLPDPRLVKLVSCWNNSPKLSNSGMSKKIRHKPDVIKTISGYKNSWFKFVIDDMEDWNEVKEDFIDTGIIKREQILLMPCGEDQEQLERTRPFTVELAVRENVRYSDRQHIVIWDKKTGV